MCYNPLRWTNEQVTCWTMQSRNWSIFLKKDPENWLRVYISPVEV
jgi:hypothetical protein